jgi:hypothetical protein
VPALLRSPLPPRRHNGASDVVAAGVKLSVTHFASLPGARGSNGSANGCDSPVKASASPIARATANRRRISRPSFGWQAENQTVPATLYPLVEIQTVN